MTYLDTVLGAILMVYGKTMTFHANVILYDNVIGYFLAVHPRLLPACTCTHGGMKYASLSESR